MTFKEILENYVGDEVYLIGEPGIPVILLGVGPEHETDLPWVRIRREGCKRCIGGLEVVDIPPRVDYVSIHAVAIPTAEVAGEEE